MPALVTQALKSLLRITDRVGIVVPRFGGWAFAAVFTPLAHGLTSFAFTRAVFVQVINDTDHGRPAVMVLLEFPVTLERTATAPARMGM